MPADDREQNFERALARHLRGASPDSSCPDAEILAAYHERTLSLDEMAHWKEHIAACTRCQESLALVEQTDHLSAEEWEHDHVLTPVEQIAALPAPRLSSAFSGQRSAPAAARAPIPETTTTPINKHSTHLPWRWVAPLGLAAAAVIVWIGFQEVRTQRLQQLQQRATQIAENRAPAPSPPVPKAAPADELSRDVSSQKPSNPQPAPRVALSAPPAPSSPSAAVNTPAKPAAKLPPTEPKNSFAVPSSEPRLVQPAAPVAGYLEKEEAADQAAQSKSDLEAARKEQSEKPTAPAAAETVEVQALARNRAAAPQVASYQNQLADLLLLAAADRHYIVAPGQTQAWRLGNDGLIEHSTDRGKTWKPQISGVTTDLTSGSAPSDKVCWIVGKGGTILLTIDGGKQWKLLASPIAADLGGVHATDAMHASVWDVSNRNSFETADGGATWTRTTNE